MDWMRCLAKNCFHPEVIDYWLVLLVLLVLVDGTHVSCISSLLKLDLFCLFCPVHCEQFTNTLESPIECVIGESGKLFRFEGLRLSRSSCIFTADHDTKDSWEIHMRWHNGEATLLIDAATKFAEAH